MPFGTGTKVDCPNPPRMSNLLISIGAIMGSQIVALIILRPFMGRVSDKIGR